MTQHEPTIDGWIPDGDNHERKIVNGQVTDEVRRVSNSLLIEVVEIDPPVPAIDEAYRHIIVA